MEKKLSRRRRATKARAKMKELNAIRLCVNKTNQHIYAQLIESAPQGDKVLASASTLDKEVQSAGGKSANVHSAGLVGNIIAKRALANGVQKIAFDRSGFKYHGCIEALAQAARESGLQF